MKLLRPFLLLGFLFFLMPATHRPVNAQNRLNNCADIQKNGDFLALADRRAELIAESQQLRDDIGKLEKELPNAMREADFQSKQKQLDDLEKKPAQTRTPLEEQTRQNLQNELKLAKTDTSITSEVKKKQDVLSTDKDLLLCVQETISQLNSPDQVFRKTMSIAFAGLIAAVIVGFFVLAFIDESMRRAIFSGETGIQFLTLFSLVIAIILFGITSILEGKELSALLGGLSGYILGRTGRPGGNATQPAAAAGPAAFQTFIKDLKSISLVPPIASLSASSKTAQLAAEPKDVNGAVIKDADAIFAPAWESSDTKVAKVDQSGLVSMVGAGSCTVTASFANLTSSPCQVTCT